VNIISCMLPSFYEIRVCQSCGLRYPLPEGHPFGKRCPQCLGETRIEHKLPLADESPDRGMNPSSKHAGFRVLLDNIRSAWNVGSILRSADGFGFSHAYLCGITPSPDQEEVRKTALGAEETVTWSQHKDALKLAQGLKREGWLVWALEVCKGSQALPVVGAEAFPDVVLIVGNEVTGVEPGLLDLADKIVSIPMAGKKRSFNVAVAFGIAAFTLTR
jgi:23S rRNA (guanosine2251-2'-O)-methyltransferase